MKNLIVGQSGGPTSVINSSLAGVIDYAISCGEIKEIYGMINGIEGLLEENYINLGNIFRHMPSELNRLKVTPAMYLGSCRYKLTGDKDELKKVVEILQKLDVGYFVYIGGNDSMDTVKKLSDYTIENGIDIKVVGVPKTIDNDLMGIDHSPGFGSAAKYIASCVREVAYDTSIYSIKSVHIIEAMGRNAGWVTAASALARQEDMIAPHLIYLPEIAFSVEKFVQDVRDKLEQYNSIIVVVSEGIRDENGEYICAKNDKKDIFGHAQLSGTGEYLKSVVEKEIGCKVRSLEPSVIQRSAGHISSLTDVEEAFNLGGVAVDAAMKGKSGIFSTIRRISNKPYTIEYTTEDVAVVANREKKVPRSWINKDGNDVTDEMIAYIRPLIEGVVQTPYRNGLPDYIDIRHLDVKKQNYKNPED